MKSKRLLRTILILLLLALNIGCDQVSKAIVRDKMDSNSYYPFLHNHFTLVRVENTGAFLSLGDSLPGILKIVLLNILPLIAIIWGIVFILTKINLNRLTLFSLILIIGGGAGNLYDRMVHGSVTDFMWMNLILFKTGVFNVADLSITTGVIIIMIQALLERKQGLVETEK